MAESAVYWESTGSVCLSSPFHFLLCIPQNICFLLLRHHEFSSCTQAKEERTKIVFFLCLKTLQCILKVIFGFIMEAQKIAIGFETLHGNSETNTSLSLQQRTVIYNCISIYFSILLHRYHVEYYCASRIVGISDPRIQQQLMCSTTFSSTRLTDGYKIIIPSLCNPPYFFPSSIHLSILPCV